MFIFIGRLYRAYNTLGHVTSVEPLYLLNNRFPDHVSNVNMNQHQISFPAIYNITIFGQFNFWLYRAYNTLGHVTSVVGRL